MSGNAKCFGLALAFAGLVVACTNSGSRSPMLPTARDDGATRSVVDGASPGTANDSGTPAEVEPALDASAALPEAPIASMPTDSGSADSDAGPRPTEAVLEVPTKPLGGSDFEPRNVGAIWVEDAQRAPIKLLELWAGARRAALKTFRMTELAGEPLPVDAVTHATLASHSVHQVRWDLTGRDGVLVPDGAYDVWIEVTDNLTSTAVTSVRFVKGPTPVVVENPATSAFGTITLTYR